MQSIRIARERGATMRVGPELEITYVYSAGFASLADLHRLHIRGYGCLDHFLEGTTAFIFDKSWFHKSAYHLRRHFDALMGSTREDS